MTARIIAMAIAYSPIWALAAGLRNGQPPMGSDKPEHTGGMGQAGKADRQPLGGFLFSINRGIQRP